jgi:hypothetical protein
MGLFRSYAKFKMGKAAFDKARRWWTKRQRAKSGSMVKARR